jgi:hypothetical protein
MVAARGIVAQECKRFVNRLQVLLLFVVSALSRFGFTRLDCFGRSNKQTNTIRCHGARMETREATSATSRNPTLGEVPKV